MGKRMKVKFYVRAILLIIVTLIGLYNTSYILNVLDYQIFWEIDVMFLGWLFLFVEMVVILIPFFNTYSYSGKHLERHFNQQQSYNEESFVKFKNENIIRAIRSALFWITINIPIIIFYYLNIIQESHLYWLFFFYYFMDTFCINYFCVFHKYITRNQCCNQCRIYNWAHIMYLTPLILIPNIYTYSLILLALIILFQWERSAILYPERFTPITNKTLQCKHCSHDCRYNTK